MAKFGYQPLCKTVAIDWTGVVPRVIVGIDNVPTGSLVKNVQSGNYGWVIKVAGQNRFVLLDNMVAQTDLEAYKSSQFKIIPCTITMENNHETDE